jgi:hypothetical protein
MWNSVGLGLITARLCVGNKYSSRFTASASRFQIGTTGDIWDKALAMRTVG